MDTTTEVHDWRTRVKELRAALDIAADFLSRWDDAVTEAHRDDLRVESPTQTIDACNRLAGLFVKLKKLDDAEQVIARAATAAKATPTGEGKRATRQTQSWAKAYARMSARRALQRARDKVNKAHKDAVEVERKK